MDTRVFNGIVIGVVTSGRPVDLHWAMSLPLISAPVGMSVAWMVKQGPDRAANREFISEKSVEMGASYVFFIDDDTVIPNFGLRHLHHALEQDPKVMICGGIYCTKEDIPCPIVFKKLGAGPYWKWKINDVFPCAGLGAGAMLIKTEVFQHISKPWFNEPDVEHVDKVVTVGGTEMPLMREGGTDDLYFCKKVTEAGFKILAHGGVLPIHIGQDGKMYTLPMESYPVKGMGLKELKQNV